MKEFLRAELQVVQILDPDDDPSAATCDLTEEDSAAIREYAAEKKCSLEAALARILSDHVWRLTEHLG